VDNRLNFCVLPKKESFPHTYPVSFPYACPQGFPQEEVVGKRGAPHKEELRCTKLLLFSLDVGGVS